MRLIASGWFSSEVSSKNFSITLKSAVLIVNLRILSELHEQCQVGLEKNIGKHLFISNILLMEKSRGSRSANTTALIAIFLKQLVVIF